MAIAVVPPIFKKWIPYLGHIRTFNDPAKSIFIPCWKLSYWLVIVQQVDFLVLVMACVVFGEKKNLVPY